MKYYIQNGIYIVEVPVSDFSVVMCDSAKKSAAKSNYCNAGFFANYNEGKDKFTLPVGHTVCDFKASSAHTKKYCRERGTFSGDKYRFDSGKFNYMNQFYGKAVSTLVVRNGEAAIGDIKTLPENVSYALSGVPIMKNGGDIKFKPYVVGQGWDASPLYSTWHIFVGLKDTRKTIYVMGMRTRTGNMITSAEAYKKFKALGFVDVIKLDGGGSFHLNVNGKAVASTMGNRRINTIICFGSSEKGSNSAPDISKGNPYREPTVVLRRGSSNTEGVKWMQQQLLNKGFVRSTTGQTMTVDGSFGPTTLDVLKQFQKANGLAVDGSCGPATRAVLKR